MFKGEGKKHASFSKRDTASWLADSKLQQLLPRSPLSCSERRSLQWRGTYDFSAMEPAVNSAGDLPAWISMSSLSPQEIKSQQDKEESARPHFLSRSGRHWRKENAARRAELRVGASAGIWLIILKRSPLVHSAAAEKHETDAPECKLLEGRGVGVLPNYCVPKNSDRCLVRSRCFNQF